MSSHPNTTAAGLSGGAATLLVYFLNKYAGTHLNAQDGTGIATALAAIVLFIGRRGVKAALRSIWLGSTPTTPTTPLPTRVADYVPPSSSPPPPPAAPPAA
jgi:hypothetical protein